MNLRKSAQSMTVNPKSLEPYPAHMQKPMTGNRKQKGNPGEMLIRHGNKPIDGIVCIEVQHKPEEHNKYPGNVSIACRGKHSAKCTASG